MADRAHSTVTPEIHELSGSTPPGSGHPTFSPKTAPQPRPRLRPRAAETDLATITARLAPLIRREHGIQRRLDTLETHCLLPNLQQRLDRISSRMLRRITRWTHRLMQHKPADMRIAAIKADVYVEQVIAGWTGGTDDLSDRLALSIAHDVRTLALEAELRISVDDDALLALIARHGTVMKEMDAADDAVSAPAALYMAKQPGRPEALYWRAEDRRIAGGRERHPTKDCWLLFYIDEDIERMRDKPATTIVEHRRPADWDPNDTIVRREHVADPRGEARRQEILAAWDAWMAEQGALLESTGLNAANAAVDAISEAAFTIEEEILAYQPQTFTGLKAKARWIVSTRHDPNRGEAILRDLWRMPAQPATAGPIMGSAHTPDRRAVAAYREWLHMEARLLGMEMYPEMGANSDRVMPASTAAVSYHFPTGSMASWRDLPQPSTRAEAMCKVLGIDWTTDEARDEHFMPVVPATETTRAA